MVYSTLLLLLSACGESSTGKEVKPVAPLSASDDLSAVAGGSLQTIDLSDFVAAGTSGAVVSDVRLKTEGDRVIQCGQAKPDGLGFSVSLSGSTLCQYEYTVRSGGPTEIESTATATMLVMVLSQTEILHLLFGPWSLSDTIRPLKNKTVPSCNLFGDFTRQYYSDISQPTPQS